jgi:hypothetical protein
MLKSKLYSVAYINRNQARVAHVHAYSCGGARQIFLSAVPRTDRRYVRVIEVGLAIGHFVKESEAKALGH